MVLWRAYNEPIIYDNQLILSIREITPEILQGQEHLPLVIRKKEPLLRLEPGCLKAQAPVSTLQNIHIYYK